MNTQGSFWTAFGVRFGQQQSSVDELLEKDPVSIEDILAHDDVIQECKYMNSALIEYLSKKETLEKLIRYIITVPDDSKAAGAAAAGGAAAAADTKDAAAAAGADGKDAAADAREPPRLNKAGNPRFPYVASELFACEVVSMLEALFAHPDLLDLLLSFLVTNKPPLNPASAGYFRKVVVVLIQRKHAQLVRHIQQKHLIDHFVNHIGLYSIMELLIMIGWDDGLGQQNDVTWLYNENLIPKLIAKLDPKYEFESEVHINAARALVDIVVKCPTNKPSTLVSHMKTQAVLDQLFTYLFSGNASSFTNCLSVVIVLVQSTANLRNESLKIDGDAPKEDGAAAAAAAGEEKPKDTAADGKAADGKSAPAADGKAAAGAGADAKAADGKAADGKAADAKDAKSGDGKAEDDGEDWSLVTPIIQLLYKNLEPLCKLCTDQPVGFFLLSNDLAEVKTQFGVLKPPLGETRLKLVELFLVACRCNYKRLNALLHKLDVIPYVMQLFYQYAWNNMLHGLVENLVQTITESEADILKRSLFFNAKFIENVVEAHKKNVEIVAKPRGFRLGFMGHLLRMCNTLVQTIQKSPSTKAIMTETGKYKDWETFVAGALADENKTSSIILGGVRPPNPNAPQQAGGDAAGAGGEGGDQGGMLDAQSLSAIGNGQLNTSGVGSNDFHDFDGGAAGSAEGAGDARSGDNGFHSGGYDDDDDDLGASSKWSDFSQFDEQHKKHREDGKAAVSSPESGANGAVASDDKDFAAFRANAATNADANDSVQTGDSPAKAAPAAGAAVADDDFGAIAARDKPADAAAAAATPAAVAAAAAAPAAAAAAGAADAPKTAGTAKPDDWAQFTTTPNF